MENKGIIDYILRDINHCLVSIHRSNGADLNKLINNNKDALDFSAELIEILSENNKKFFTKHEKKFKELKEIIKETLNNYNKIKTRPTNSNKDLDAIDKILNQTRENVSRALKINSAIIKQHNSKSQQNQNKYHREL